MYYYSSVSKFVNPERYKIMKKVTEQVKSEIKERYPSEDSHKLAEDLGFSYHTIMKWAQKLELKKSSEYKPHNALGQREEDMLTELYPTEPMESLCRQMNKKPGAIHELARKRGIKRIINETRKGTLEPLFNKSIESYYWLGFISADGYVAKNGHFMISQSEKDKQNIEKLAEYLSSNIYVRTGKSGFNENYTCYRINICDKVLGPKLNDLFGLKDGQKKTYTALSLDFIKTKDQATAFLCGVIDGDGSKQAKSYRIQCHKSQLSTFTNLSNLLPKEVALQVSLKYRKDKDDFFCHADTLTKSSNYLREFCQKNNIGSTRKFS